MHKWVYRRFEASPVLLFDPWWRSFPTNASCVLKAAPKSLPNCTFSYTGLGVVASLAKRARPAEQEAAGSELSGYRERAAFAGFERDLLGQHDVPNRKITYRQET
jgi:hypothetical protein